MGDVATAWAVPGARSKYNMGVPTAGPGHSELTHAATPTLAAATAGKLTHPDNPLFAFGALALLAMGLAGASTSARFRIGKAHVGGSLHAGTHEDEPKGD